MSDSSSGSSWVNAIPIIGPIAGLFGSLFGAHEQASGATDAARISAQAQETIAAQQAQAAAAALTFSKAGAENGFQNSEVARAGNYDQWAAAQRRIGSVAKLLGFGDREIPAYRPGVDPNFDGSGGAASGTPSAGTPSDPTAVLAALTHNYQTLGVTPTGPGTGPTDIAYFAKQIAATGGLAPNNTAYWFGPDGRIAQEIAKARGGAAAPAPAANQYALSRYL